MAAHASSQTLLTVVDSNVIKRSLISGAEKLESKTHQYHFDAVFEGSGPGLRGGEGGHSSQRSVYTKVASPIVRNLVEGVSGAIIAYGCTGTGKTHTMIGSSALHVGAMVRTRLALDHNGNLYAQNLIGEGQEQWATAQFRGYGESGGYVVRFWNENANKHILREIPLSYIDPRSLYHMDPHDDQAGLIPRIFTAVFARLDNVDDGDGGQLLLLNGEEVLLEVSFVQLGVRHDRRREQLRDLLVPSNTGITVKLSSEGKGGMSFKTTAARKPVQSVQECMELLRRGLLNRALGSTGRGENSIHTIFFLHLTRTAALGESLSSTLSLADLAGSECLIQRGKHKSFDEKQRDMAISRSLITLGQVITALSKSSKTESNHVHIPFRSSILTKLLHGALMGGAQSAIVATCGPSKLPEPLRETLATLKFAEKANKIQIRPRRKVVTSRATLSLALLKFSKLERRYEDGRKVAIEVRQLMRRVVQQITQKLSVEQHVAAMQIFPCLSTDIVTWDVGVSGRRVRG